MDITALHNISSGAVTEALKSNAITGKEVLKTDRSAFDQMLSSALDNLNTTNAYLSEAENEKIKWALGESTNTHDLTNALQKSSVALQYTVAIRDKFLEAYREIMQMQI